MQVTKVIVKPINGESRLKGILSVTFDDAFVVHEVKVIEGKDGLFVAMPSTKGKTGFHDLAHPINQEMRQQLDEACLKAYKEALENNTQPEEDN